VLILNACQFSYLVHSSAGTYCHSTWDDEQVDGKKAGKSCMMPGSNILY